LAKKKPRTPTPPRKVQAPQRRPNAPRAKADDLGRQHRNLLYALSGSGIVALVVVVVVIAAFGGGGKTISDAQISTAFTSAGCTYRTVAGYLPSGQNMHTTSLTKTPMPWNTNPPSNGQHYYLWAVWGFYTGPVNPRRVLHNEEHGAIVEWWGPHVSQATIAKLRAFYNQQPIGGFGTPYPSLGSKIAFTAWTGDPFKYQRNGYYGQGHVAICSSFTPKVQAAAELFRRAYRGHGPEGIPLSADHPGMGPNG